jgi:putative membrane protein
MNTTLTQTTDGIYNYLNHFILSCNYLVCRFILYCTPFVYQIEAADKPSPEKEILQKSTIMTYRLWYIITWPSAVLATADVVFPLTGNAWLQMPWMHVKLGCFFVLYLYHAKTNLYQFAKRVKYTTNFMRLWNEGYYDSFAVVFLVILKNAVN